MNTVQKFEIDGGRVARFARGAVAAAVMVVIAACGGGGGGGTTELPSGETPPEVIAVQKPTATEASRFLAQATIGPTEAEIDRLTGMTYAAWLDEQFAKPQIAASPVHQPGRRRPDLRRPAAEQHQLLGLVVEPGARRATTSCASAWPSRCREIMVISFADATLRNQPRGVASYYDMLGEKRLRQLPRPDRGRDLAPDDGHLPLAPAQPEGRRATGRVPDQNYAREVTQLFSIGQYKLNADGTEIMGADGQSGDRLQLRRPERPGAGLHRPQLVRRPAAQPTAPPPLQRRRCQPRARLAADAGVRRVRREHQLPLDQREELPRHDDPGA